MGANVFPFPSDELADDASNAEVEALVAGLDEGAQEMYREFLKTEASKDVGYGFRRAGMPPALRALGRVLSTQERGER